MDSRFRGNDSEGRHDSEGGNGKLWEMWYIYIMRDCKGQNIVEYVLLVAAVVVVCVVFFKPQAGNPMYDGVNASLGGMVTQINSFTNAIQLPNN